MQLGFLQKSLKKETLLKNSKHTLSAIIVNQTFAMLIFLTVPNILGQEDYAQTVYISVLMSFLVLSNFGMNFIYGRKMPSVYHENDAELIEQYNQTFFWFSLGMSLLGSIVISFVYYMKFGLFLNAMFLVFVNPMLLIITFYIQKSSVKEDFIVYRNINMKSAAIRLIIIPFSYIFGLVGWISAQSIASLFVMGSIKNSLILKYEQFNISLIKKHLFEGLILLLNFFFWNQLLNSGRLYASIYFDSDVIAQYGITNAGYVLLQTLIISIYLPVTIATLKIMKSDTKDAIQQLFSVIIKTSIPIFFIIVFAIEFAPYLYEVFFPSYNIDFDILKYQLLSLMTLPLIATLGNVFIGLEQPLKLLLIYALSFSVSFISMYLLKEEVFILSAAISQLVGMLFLSLLLLVSVILNFKIYIDNPYKNLIQIFFIVFLPYCVYLLIRSYI